MKSPLPITAFWLLRRPLDHSSCLNRVECFRPERASDSFQQYFGVERFGKDFGAARGPNISLDGVGQVGADHEDWNLRKFSLSVDAARRLYSIHLWQGQIHNYEIGV